MSSIPESDWKRLRKLAPDLLEQACENILGSVRALIDAPGRGRHEAYLALWELMRDEDEKIVDMFDDRRRSNAIFKLVHLHRHGLLTDEMLAEFSEGTRETVLAMNRDR